MTLASFLIDLQHYFMVTCCLVHSLVAVWLSCIPSRLWVPVCSDVTHVCFCPPWHSLQCWVQLGLSTLWLILTSVVTQSFRQLSDFWLIMKIITLPHSEEEGKKVRTEQIGTSKFSKLLWPNWDLLVLGRDPCELLGHELALSDFSELQICGWPCPLATLNVSPWIWRHCNKTFDTNWILH